MNDYAVCADHLMWIANGDLSGVDYHADTPEESAARCEEIRRTTTETEVADACHLVPGDFENRRAFNRRGCDLCDAPLAGETFEVIGLDR